MNQKIKSFVFLTLTLGAIVAGGIMEINWLTLTGLVLFWAGSIMSSFISMLIILLSNAVKQIDSLPEEHAERYKEALKSRAFNLFSIKALLVNIIVAGVLFYFGHVITVSAYILSIGLLLTSKVVLKGNLQQMISTVRVE